MCRCVDEVLRTGPPHRPEMRPLVAHAEAQGGSASPNHPSGHWRHGLTDAAQRQRQTQTIHGEHTHTKPRIPLAPCAGAGARLAKHTRTRTHAHARPSTQAARPETTSRTLSPTRQPGQPCSSRPTDPTSGPAHAQTAVLCFLGGWGANFRQSFNLPNQFRGAAAPVNGLLASSMASSGIPAVVRYCG